MKRANSSSLPIFDNSIGWIKASEFCKTFGYSIKTIYEWHYRPKKNKIPENLIKKFRGRHLGGTGQQVRRRFDRKRDAEEFLDQLRRRQQDQQRGLLGGPSFLETTFFDKSAAWLDNLEMRASKSWHHTCVKNLGDFNSRHGHLTMDKITTDFLNRVQQSLKKRKSSKGKFLKNATVNRYTEAIMATLNFSVKSGSRKLIFLRSKRFFRGFMESPLNTAD